MSRITFLCAIGLLASGAALAEPPKTPGDESPDAEAQALASLEFKSGTLTIGANEVVIRLPEGFQYLNRDGARSVLEKVWHNPPNSRVDALIVPGGLKGLLETGIAVIVKLAHDGHVDDADAAKTDFDDVLESMQDDMKEESEERVKGGFDSVELLGWAEPPHYDSATKKLYWAKHLRFNGSEDTLNYDVRVLGRTSTLTFSAVSDMNRLAEVGPVCQKLLAATEFTAGHGHSDFNPSIDKVAAYGIGGLVAGKILLKVGLFAKFGAVLAKFAKLIVIAIVAGLGLLKRLFTRRAAVPPT